MLRDLAQGVALVLGVAFLSWRLGADWSSLLVMGLLCTGVARWLRGQKGDSLP